MKKRFRDVRGIASEYLPWILIALAVLVILVLFMTVLKSHGLGLISKIKTLFRWG